MKCYCRGLFLCLLLCLSTCGLRAQTELVFSPHWSAQAQFAGYYVAQANGYYLDAGLKVNIRHSTSGGIVINRLKRGEDMIVSLQLVTAMRLIDQGCHLVNILQYFQQNSQMIVSHMPIKGVKSLSGLRVGHFRNGTSELAFAMDKQYDLNIEWVPFLSHTNLYVSGAIDATLAMSYNELFQLKLAGQRIKPNQILRLGDMGYDVPEDGLYVTANYYRRHKAEIDKFAKATQKGWEWVAAHPDEALDIVMLYIQQNGIASNRIAQEWMLKECIKLIADKKTGKRNYRLEPKSLELANRILCDNNIISKPITYKQITQP